MGARNFYNGEIFLGSSFAGAGIGIGFGSIINVGVSGYRFICSTSYQSITKYFQIRLYNPEETGKRETTNRPSRNFYPCLLKVTTPPKQVKVPNTVWVMHRFSARTPDSATRFTAWLLFDACTNHILWSWTSELFDLEGGGLNSFHNFIIRSVSPSPNYKKALHFTFRVNPAKLADRNARFSRYEERFHFSEPTEQQQLGASGNPKTIWEAIEEYPFLNGLWQHTVDGASLKGTAFARITAEKGFAAASAKFLSFVDSYQVPNPTKKSKGPAIAVSVEVKEVELPKPILLHDFYYIYYMPLRCSSK